MGIRADMGGQVNQGDVCCPRKKCVRCAWRLNLPWGSMHCYNANCRQPREKLTNKFQCEPSNDSTIWNLLDRVTYDNSYRSAQYRATAH